MNALIIFGAENLWFGVIAGSLAVIFSTKEFRWRLGIVLLVALPIAYGLARVLGLLYGHSQPFAVEGFQPLVSHEVDNSFPSDHTLFAGVFASVAFLARRRFGLEMWVLTLLVGLSRMLAGLHWGIDVLAAAALAALTVWGVDTVVRKLL